MDSISIDTGEKRIAINGDPDRVIVFNPRDVVFAEKFYKLISDFETHLTEYQTRAATIDSDTNNDTNGIPTNTPARIELLKETCAYVRGQIDYLFGEGTSQKAFGDVLALDMFSQFFEGMTPYIRAARAEKIAQYVVPVSKKQRKRK